MPRLAFCSFLLLSAVGVRAQPTADSFRPLALDHITWRHIGPASFGGRIDDIEAVPGNPSTMFVGTASGGVFKSVNNGVTWTTTFDRDASALSIGDIAIAPSDPNVIWVGSGEANNRQSSSWGDGVYKSVDGGDTWQQVLFINRDTGIGEVAIDADGRTVYAASYQRRRRGFGFVGGGPGAALFRSLDGGDTWEKLSLGLPAGDLGRIGVDISKSRPNIVYAVIEHKSAGGVYRSDDRGATWTRQGGTNPRPSYYSQIRADPTNPDKVWILGSFAVSLDG